MYIHIIFRVYSELNTYEGWLFFLSRTLISRNQLMWTTFLNLFGYPRTGIPRPSSISHRSWLPAKQDAADITLDSTFQVLDTCESNYLRVCFEQKRHRPIIPVRIAEKKRKEICGSFARLTNILLTSAYMFVPPSTLASSLLFGIFRY